MQLPELHVGGVIIIKHFSMYGIVEFQCNTVQLAGFAREDFNLAVWSIRNIKIREKFYHVKRNYFASACKVLLNSLAQPDRFFPFTFGWGKKGLDRLAQATRF